MSTPSTPSLARALIASDPDLSRACGIDQDPMALVKYVVRSEPPPEPDHRPAPQDERTTE